MPFFPDPQQQESIIAFIQEGFLLNNFLQTLRAYCQVDNLPVHCLS